MLRVKTSSGKWERFCDQIVDFLKADTIQLQIDGQAVHGFRSPDSPALWIRDHSDILRAGKYTESEVKSAVECFANMQARDGRIFDHVLTTPLRHSNERENWEKWVRVPVEADVEFRFVKAAYLAWQATGDHDWLASLLPCLDRALEYSKTHHWRWDEQHGLVKRPYTIDTWDFDYTAGRSDWLNFQITDDTYWGIFHGDNSGFYESAILLSQMYTGVGREEEAQRWREVAAGVQERANALLFNGRFYTHFHKLTSVTIDGVDEAKQLSLSTPMAINRKLATHEMAAAILQEYQHRRKTGHAFAEWFGVDPPFPDGIFGDEKLKAGAYINGGIFPLVGGELARAAFEHGFERYGLQTLEQYRTMIADSGATYLWYFPNGTAASEETSTSPDAMPTDGWGSSAMLYAFIEGLCGIEDLDHSYNNVRCSPRWIAADEDQAEVRVGYKASGASFGYRYQHSKQKSKINLSLEAKSTEVSLHVLLPEGCEATSILWNGNTKPFNTHSVEQSFYVDASGKVEGQAEIEIHYG